MEESKEEKAVKVFEVQNFKTKQKVTRQIEELVWRHDWLLVQNLLLIQITMKINNQESKNKTYNIQKKDRQIKNLKTRQDKKEKKINK